MAGRKVTLPASPRRIVLLEGRDLLTMALLHPDPASLVAGWAALDRIDSSELQKRLQGGREIPETGKLTPDTISLEGLISLAPDLVVTTAFMTPPGGQNNVLGTLETLGVPVIFSDNSSNTPDTETLKGPFESLDASMRMWGQILGAEQKAEAYLAFVKKELAGITARLSGTSPVTTYLEVQSTPDDCCWAAGRKIWGELLALAGGQPLPAVTAPWFEKLSLEYLVSTPHDVYIASGGGWASGGRPSLGPGIDPETARQSLRSLVSARPNFEHLPSVRSGRVHGIWTGLITNLPLNILFVAETARWLHPEQCKDVNPLAILETINRDFAAVPVDGPLWASV